MEPSSYLKGSGTRGVRDPRLSRAWHFLGLCIALGLGIVLIAACTNRQPEAVTSLLTDTASNYGVLEPPAATDTPVPATQPIAPTNTIDPVLAGVPTARFDPTRTAEPTPVPASVPTLEIQAGLALHGINTYFDELHMLHILGEIENEGEETQEVAVGALLYDAEGGILDQVSGLTATEVIPANAISPFEILAERPAGYADFRVIVEGLASQRTPRSDLELLEVEAKLASRLAITGQIHNPGGALSEYAQVLATLYDADGRVLAIGMDFIQPQQLGAGSSSDFQILIEANLESYDRFTVVAIGY